jgi:hypothetical protein
LNTLSQNKIDTIDLLPVIENLPDPIGVYNFRKEAHFTPEGNQLVAQACLNYIKDGELPKPDAGSVLKVNYIH